MQQPEAGMLEEIMSKKDLLWSFRKSGRCYKIIGTAIDKSDCDQIKILYQDIQGSAAYTRTITDFYYKFTPIVLG